MKTETLRLALTAAVAAAAFAGCQTAPPVREYSGVQVYRTEPVGEYTVEHHARLFSNEPYTQEYTTRRTSYSAIEPVGDYVIKIRRQPVQPLGIEPISDYAVRTRATPIYVRPAAPQPVGESVIIAPGSTVYRTYDAQRSSWERPVPYGPNSPTGPSNW